MIEDQNPLKHELEAELNDSEWLQKFKAWGLLLQQLKTEVPVTQLCQLQWVTGADDLVIHCSNSEIRDALKQQAQKIYQLNKTASQIIVRLSGYRRSSD
ncbi:MAG: hypothetical protein F6J87_06785 [Spirulina sp. SIO3F2]|nr:hypothetical protein [Spirulina sp. SIO3F2]